MKNFKVLALTAVVSLVAAPALAGETYVRNEWSDTHSVTKTDLHMDSTTKSIRLEAYDSYADKTYVDGKLVSTTEGNYDADGTYNGHWNFKGKEGGHIDLDGEYTEVSSTSTVGDKGYTEHNAGSNLWGFFAEKVVTNVNGTINTVSRTNSTSHETSAGVR